MHIAQIKKDTSMQKNTECRIINQTDTITIIIHFQVLHSQSSNYSGEQDDKNFLRKLMHEIQESNI